ncbi:MAG: PepSY domain-containing protein, partial [Fervidobacterium sp.]
MKYKILIASLIIFAMVNAQTIDEQFKQINGYDWGVEVAEWGYITSANKPRPTESGLKINQQQAIQTANSFLSINANFFGMESLNYSESAKITDAEGYKSWVVVYEGQRFEGLPVTDTHTTVIMTEDGQVFAVGNLRYQFEEEVSVKPSVPKEEAVEQAQSAIPTEQEPTQTQIAIKGVSNGTHINPRLVWNVKFGCPLAKAVDVDAKTGEVLEIKNLEIDCEIKTNYIIYSAIVSVILFGLIIAIVLIKKKNRKGIAFGFIIVFVALTLISLVSLQRSIVYRQKEKLYIQNRINDINNMYESIVRDVNKAVEIITKRAVSTAVSNILTTGIPLSQADNSIEELTMYGTLSGNPQPLMSNATLLDWADRIKSLGSLKGYYVELKFENFEIKPYDSFNIEVLSDININITDKNGVASIVRKGRVDRIVSILGFEDPTYALNTNGRATNLFKKSKYSGNYTMLLVAGNGSSDWEYGISVVLPSSNSTAIDAVQNKNTKILVTDDATVLSSSTLNQFLGVVSEGGVANGTTTSYVINANQAMSRVPNGVNILLDAPNGKVWYIDNFKEHAEQSYYEVSSVGASFF